ncbi:MAG: PDZ domain-containing protein [Kouleothrix sp.]|jgi:S1-C subfamily serine protease
MKAASLLLYTLLFFVLLAILAACGSGKQIFVDYPAPVLGIVADAQLHIIDIEPGSAAEQAGLQRGDVIVALGQQAAISLEQLRRAIVALAPQQAVDLTFRREGAEHRVRMMPAAPAPRASSATPTPMPGNMYYF